ncbi:NINE protein [Ferrovibrio sp.]|uniref:NINE protein n=1 Tax=Ferrovibrio sp. TaxID=1917215 RepID=UPI003D0F4A05
MVNGEALWPELNSERPSVNRLTLLFFTMLAGFWGGHKFLLGARREGWLYLLLAWTAIPLLASLVDLLDLLRQPPLGHGFLRRRLPKRYPWEGAVIERTTLLRLCGSALFMVLLVLGFSLAESV